MSKVPHRSTRAGYDTANLNTSCTEVNNFILLSSQIILYDRVDVTTTLMLLFFWAEAGESMFLRNVGIYRRVYTAQKPRTTSSSSPP
jgi:hypothetical protein